MSIQRDNKSMQNFFEEQHGYNGNDNYKFVQQLNIYSVVQENSLLHQTQEQLIRNIRQYDHDPIKQNQMQILQKSKLFNDIGDRQRKKRGIWRTFADLFLKKVFFKQEKNKPFIIQQQEEIPDLIPQIIYEQQQQYIHHIYLIAPLFLDRKIASREIQYAFYLIRSSWLGQDCKLNILTQLRTQEDSNVLQYFKTDQAKVYDSQRLIKAKIRQ